MAEKNTPPMAKVSTHTPGPWKAEPNGNIIASNLWVLASIDRFPSPDVNSKANAELIAAAPELLEALERSLVNSRAIPRKPHRGRPGNSPEGRPGGRLQGGIDQGYPGGR
jgi:hypothetical protein